MEELVINTTKTSEGNDCLITKNAHVLKVDGFYIATLTTIYKGWMGTDTKSSSFVFDNFADAVKACDEYLG